MGWFRVDDDLRAAIPFTVLHKTFSIVCVLHCNACARILEEILVNLG